MNRYFAVLNTRAVLSTLAVVASLVLASVPTVSAQSGQSVPIEFELLPEDPIQRDVRNGTRLRENPDGGAELPSAEPVASATWVGIQADGVTEIRRPLESFFVQPAEDSNVDFWVRNGPEGLDVYLQAPCIYGPPGLANCQPHGGAALGYLEVTLANGGGTYRSEPYKIDYIGPVLISYNVEGPRTIRVVFSEPVRIIDANGNEGQDSPADWRVDGGNNPVLRVQTDPEGPICRNRGFPAGTTGCSRLLTVANNIPQDSPPFVNYDQELVVIDDPTRTVYEDFARNTANTRSLASLDRLRPAAPNIVDVIDRDPVVPTTPGCQSGGLEQVIGNSATPTLTFDNINADHTFLVEVDGTTRIAERALPAGPPYDVTLADGLSSGDRGYVLKVVALDPADNRSDAMSAAPSERSDGEVNPVCYRLDTRPPLPGNAVRNPGDLSQIVVTFLEDVVQNGPADSNPLTADPDPHVGRWRVDPGGPNEQVAADVTRGDTSRQLLVSFPDTVGPTIPRIVWEPCPSGDSQDGCDGSQGDTYTDVAGNAMAAFELGLSLPALLGTPIFTNPVPGNPPVYTNQQQDHPITGQLAAGDDPADVTEINVTATPEVDGLANPQPQPDGTWATTADFPDDGSYQFTAQALGAFDNDSPVRTSSVVVFDGTPPEVEILSPQNTGGTILTPGEPARVAAGQTVEVELSVDEDNFDRATVTIDYMEGPEGGQQVVSTADPDQPDGNGDPGSPFLLTFDPPTEYVGEVQLTATATDLATNTSAEVVRTIILDDSLASPIRSVLRNAPTQAVVELEFPVALTGSTVLTDWEAVTNGVNENSISRRPVQARAEGNLVTLTFGEPFPSLLAGADRNAAPRITYTDSALGNLGAEGDREVVVNRRIARDIDPPEAPTVTPASVGPTSVEPGGSVTFTAQTHESAKPNFFRVLQIPAGADPATAAGTPLPLANERADEDGTFTFDVTPVSNATTNYRVEVRDPAGNPENPLDASTVVTVIEDSLGPDVQTLVASLRDADTVDINIGFDPVDEATHADVGYLAAGDTEPTQINGNVTIGQDGRGMTTWNVPDDVDLTAGGIQIRAVGRDAVGNLGVPKLVGLSNVPELESAVSASATSVLVTVSEPVATEQTDGAGFTIQNGPGVTSTSVDSQGRILLELNAELPSASDLRVAYNGAGGWAAPDGRPLQAGTVPLVVGTLFPVTGLAAGPDGDGGVVLSYVDERNEPSEVAGYEIARDDEVRTQVGAGQRIYVDPSVADGSHTYSVVTVATDGRRSEPATVTLTVGDSPVPDSAADAAVSGGTGFPSASTLVDECEFTATANVTSEGGTVLSCDGRVAALVPPGAVDTPVFAKFIQRAGPAAGNFEALTDLYQLVGVTAGDYATVDDFAAYTELSVRDMGPALADVVRQRVTNVRATDDGPQEQAPRAGRESVASQFLTLGTFRTVLADGPSLRIYGPDPAIAPDRFATAAGLSQTQFRQAGAAVLARADDYPDALAAAPLAALVGGPVLLSRTTDVARTTLLELARLGVDEVVLVGGTAALSIDTEQQLLDLGYQVRRIGGQTRFETAALVAAEVGSVDGGAFLATGQNFADALSASAPAAHLGRPILLAAHDLLVEETAAAIAGMGLDRVRVVGGTAALTEGVADAVAALGPRVTRSAGQTRFETAVDLAADLTAESLLTMTQPLMASGDGDGVTSPDALAAGPIGGRLGTPLLLTPRSQFPDVVADHLRDADGLRGILLAGGPAAVTDEVRALIDAAGGPQSD